ncbi:MAG: DUF1080 domain-containing protein [Bryobacteraceae bacterium]|nr:DUF1080 domain-containing protein [Bryobacteraceae bacterium]
MKFGYDLLKTMCARPLVLTVLFLAPFAASGQKKQEWVQLFNGRNLDGWTPKISGYALGEDPMRTFRVENGVIRASYENYPRFDNRFGHLFFKRKFSNYRIVVEYRFTGEQAAGGPGWALRNSGIMVHCQAPETMGKDQDFPISIEVQLLGGNGVADRTTGNLCTPGTNVEMGGKLVTQHCINSKSKTFHGEQWVRAEVEVRGGKVVRHWINGEVVLEYEKPQIGGGNVSNFDPAAKKDGVLLSEGYISLQSESHPVEFRKVEVLELEQ